MYNKKALKVDLGKYKESNPYKGDIEVSTTGQWGGKGIYRIPSNDITMKGVPFPVMAYPNVGDPVLMQPGQDYQFPENVDYVDEYPVYQKGGFQDDINKRRQVLRDWTYGADIGMLQEQDGGDYIETDLTDEEIEEYRKGGYIVEDISIPSLTKAQDGLDTGVVKTVTPWKGARKVAGDENAPPVIFEGKDVTVKAKAPDWARFTKEYETANPQDRFLQNEQSKYVRKNKGLNKLAGVTMENFPKAEKERILQEYNQKKNTYITKRLAKEYGFDPNKREQWVDYIPQGSREYDIIAGSKYGSKLKPNAWSRTLSGARSVYNALPLPDVTTRIPGMTEAENKAALTDPLQGLELLAPTEVPGIVAANYLKNANSRIAKPGSLSGEYMPNVSMFDVLAVNPLTVLDVYGLPRGAASIGRGAIKGTQALGKGVNYIGKSVVNAAGIPKVYSQGGFTNNYIELELTPEEITHYRDGGYYVEELPEAQSGFVIKGKSNVIPTKAPVKKVVQQEKVLPNKNTDKFVIEGKSNIVPNKVSKPIVESGIPLEQTPFAYKPLSKFIPENPIEPVGKVQVKLPDFMQRAIDNPTRQPQRGFLDTWGDIGSSSILGDTDEFMENSSVYDLTSKVNNYLARRQAKTSDKAEPAVKPITVNKESEVKNPIIIGDPIDLDNRKYYAQEVVDLNNVKFGYRNRGEYNDIKTEAGNVTAFNPFTPKRNFKTSDIKKSETFIGIDKNGKFKSGSIDKFSPDDLISKTFSNVVVDFVYNPDGTIKLEKRNKDNPDNPVPLIKVMENGKEKVGSLNFLTKANNKNPYEQYGEIQGGKVILKAGDKVILVSGSINDVATQFKKLKAETKKPIEFITLDNGSYNLGLRTKDKVITKSDLKAYDNLNNSGGNFLYLMSSSTPEKPNKQSNTGFKPKSINDVSKVEVKKDLPDFSNLIDSPTAKYFKKEIIDKNYTYGMSTDPLLKAKKASGKGLPNEKEIDCSGAVCKVLTKKGVNVGDPTVNNSAQHFHDRSKPIKWSNAKDGDLITMSTENNGVDHIGFLVIDKKTGRRFIAESSRSFNEGRIVPFYKRIEFLKSKYPDFEYSIRRL